jgi:hypothetical protein
VRPRKSHLIGLAFVCLTGAVGLSPALGVIVGGSGPEGDGTNTAPFTDSTNSSYGKYGGMTMDYVYKAGSQAYGSAVAIGYFEMITARHFGAGAGNIYEINGDQFEVIAKTPAPKDQGENSAPDLEILTFRNNTHPNRPLPGFYQIYSAAPPSGQVAVIVGTGRTGYMERVGSTSWIPHEVTESPDDPLTVRWGTNNYATYYPNTNPKFPATINSIRLTPFIGPVSTKCFNLPFAYTPTGTKDCGYGNGDSGGGVFFKDSSTGTWKLGGINLYVNAWPGGGTYDDQAASMYSYASWISNTLVGLNAYKLPGDADGDQNVDLDDYFILKENYGKTGMTWEQGDFTGNGVGPNGLKPDGIVDRYDLAALETNWGDRSAPYNALEEGYTIGPGGLVPEPASLALLAAGGVGLLLRRVRRGGENDARGKPRR